MRDAVTYIRNILLVFVEWEEDRKRGYAGGAPHCGRSGSGGWS